MYKIQNSTEYKDFFKNTHDKSFQENILVFLEQLIYKYTDPIMILLYENPDYKNIFYDTKVDINTRYKIYISKVFMFLYNKQSEFMPADFIIKIPLDDVLLSLIISIIDLLDLDHIKNERELFTEIIRLFLSQLTPFLTLFEHNISNEITDPDEKILSMLSAINSIYNYTNPPINPPDNPPDNNRKRKNPDKREIRSSKRTKK
jgi:hypothetical protein